MVFNYDKLIARLEREYGQVFRSNHWDDIRYTAHLKQMLSVLRTLQGRSK